MRVGFHQVDVWNLLEFKKQSKQIGEFLLDDFGSIAEELRAAFPHTRGLQERYVPLVSRFAQELTGLYRRPVVRRFQNPTAPNAAGFVALQAAYDDADFNAFMDEVHRALIVQRTIAVMVWPGDLPGTVRFQAFEPWQIDWQSRDANRAADLRAVERIELQVPATASEVGVTFDRVVLTPTQAWREQGGKRVGIYADDLSHPFRGVPLVVLRARKPPPGRWAAPINEALLNMQIALCIGESDQELLVHHQAWGQKVIEGAQTAQQVEHLQIGPDKILALVSHDPEAPSPSLKVVQGNPPLAQITGWKEARLRLLFSMFDLNPDAILKTNTALTASARAADQRDRDEARDDILPQLQRAERDLARLVARVLNLRSVLQIDADGLDVDLQFSTWQPPVDPLHETQAVQLAFGMGIDSPAAYVARRDGITAQQAQRIVDDNLRRWREQRAAEQRIEGASTEPVPS